MKKTLVGLAVASSLLLSGCVIKIDGEGWDGNNDHSSWQSHQRQNKSYINSLELGVAIKTVTDELGEADFVEAFEKEGKKVKVLFYRTHHKRSDGSTTKDETTPLVFVDGKLKGIGKKAYASYH